MIRDKQIALYLAMGFELIPLRGGDGEHTSKKPLEGITWKDKVKYKGRIIDPRETADLLRSIPESNIGIATGERSGLAVVDIDTGQDIEQARKVLSSLSLPEDTATVTTGRGLHFYFKTTGQVKSSKGPGYDIKGNGGYVVAPPSTHASGRIYAFLQDRGLEVIKPATFPDTVTRPVTLPVTLPGPDTNTPGRTAGDKSKVVSRLPGQGLLSERLAGLGVVWSIVKGLECVKQMFDYQVEEGHRHDVLYMLYCLLIYNGDRARARKIIEWKNSELKAPLTEGDLQARVFSGKIYPHCCERVREGLPFKVNCEECRFIGTKRGERMLGNEGMKVLKDEKCGKQDFLAWLLIKTGQVDLDQTPPGKLAKLFCVTRPTVKSIINRLTKGGYIEDNKGKLFK